MGDGLRGIDELIERAAAGDRSALESLLLHFHDPLLEFIRATLAVKDSTDFSADDLLQETLVEAFRGMRGLEARGKEAFFGWLKAIARSRHLNRVKAAKALKRGGDRNRVVDVGDGAKAATTILHLIAGPEATPSVIARRKEAVTVIAAALAKLDADRRRVIDLRYGQGLSIAEVAAHVGRSEGAVKMLVSRILDELRGSIRAEFKEFSAGA